MMLGLKSQSKRTKSKKKKTQNSCFAQSFKPNDVDCGAMHLIVIVIEKHMGRSSTKSLARLVQIYKEM